MRSYKVTLIALVAFLQSCCVDKKKEPAEKEVLQHDFNLILAPDLSNRIDPKIYPKPIHDTIVMHSIFTKIDKVFLNLEKRKINQKDKYRVDFLNPEYLNGSNFEAKDFLIDFSVFGGDQKARIDYRQDKLASDIEKVDANIGRLYQKALAKTSGAEIYNYLNSLVNESLDEHEPLSQKLIGSEITVLTVPKNVVVLFTDGYIENSYDKKGYSLGNQEITAIRKSFETSGSKNLEEFIDLHPEFQLVPLDNPKLTVVNLLVVEMNDRSLVKGVPSQRPPDLDIVKAVWRNWLTNSKLADFDFVRSQNTAEKVVDEIQKFMERPSP